MSYLAPRSLAIVPLALISVLLIAARPASAGDVFPYPIHQTTLDNGLRVVVVPYDSPGIVAYFTIVRTGSREEVEPGHSGFAHFFEHMMFRGTPRYSPEEYNDALKRLGADSNAFTTDDYTSYYIVGPSAELELMMDLESDRFRNLEYDEEAFKTEALAVLGEYNKNASSPSLPMFEKMRSLAFTQHTYAHTTLGFLEDIQAMPGYYDYSLRFFDRFYRPENTVLLIVGDVEAKQTFEKAKKHYGPWEPGYQPVDIATEPPPEAKQTAEIDWPSEIRPHLMMGWRSPAFTTATKDTAALHLIAQLLFSDSAPLYQKLVVDEQWVDTIQGSQGDRRDPYLFTVFARLREPQALPKVKQAIFEHVGRLQSEPVDEERLERIRSHLRYDLVLDNLDSPGSVAFTLGRLLSLTGDPESLDELYAQYEKVAPKDIRRVARKVFRDEGLTVVTLEHTPEVPKAADEAGTPTEARR